MNQSHSCYVYGAITVYFLKFVADTQSYVLNFHGRVTQASVKNFQIVHDNDGMVYLLYLNMYMYELIVLYFSLLTNIIFFFKS